MLSPRFRLDIHIALLFVARHQVSFHISVQNFKSVLEQESKVVFTKLHEDIYVLNIKMVSNQQTAFQRDRIALGYFMGSRLVLLSLASSKLRHFPQVV